jgi:hypothetical protein
MSLFYHSQFHYFLTKNWRWFLLLKRAFGNTCYIHIYKLQKMRSFHNLDNIPTKETTIIFIVSISYTVKKVNDFPGPSRDVTN